MKDWTEQPVVFACGESALLGIVHHARGQSAGLGVLVVVGGPQYRVGSHRQFTLMARALAAGGFPVMRFDYRGMGDSEGETRSFEAVGADIRAAIDAFVHAVPSLRTLVLWGLCDAASAILIDGCDDPRVGGLILVNPWVRTGAGEARSYVRNYYPTRLLHPTLWRKLFSGRLNPSKALAEFFRTYRLARTYRAEDSVGGSHFIERMRLGLEAFRGPVLVLLSERDLTAREFADLAGNASSWSRIMTRSNVRVVDVLGADHTFSERKALAEAIEHCRAQLEGLLGSNRAEIGNAK
ncbi:MAG: hydrolase 1, exosortase A system-associated [Gammaproteobacteria bacterium]